MSFREKGKKRKRFLHALPCYSVDSEEDARALQVTACSMGYNGRSGVPGFGGELDDLEIAAERFDRFYRVIKARQKK